MVSEGVTEKVSASPYWIGQDTEERSIVKCVDGIEAVDGANARASSEQRNTGSQEKLLAIMNIWPVPKPTQVVKANSLR